MIMKTANLLFAVLFFFIPIGAWSLVLTDNGSRTIEGILFMGLLTLVSLVISGLFAYHYINGDLEKRGNKAGIGLILVLLFSSCSSGFDDLSQLGVENKVTNRADSIREMINYLTIQYPDSYKLAETGWHRVEFDDSTYYSLEPEGGLQLISTYHYDILYRLYQDLSEQKVTVSLGKSEDLWILYYKDKITLPDLAPVEKSKRKEPIVSVPYDIN